MKIRCRKCGKRFSGEANKVQAILSCPKCAASGDWWESIPESVTVKAHAETEASTAVVDAPPTVDKSPCFQIVAAPPPIIDTQAPGWGEAQPAEDEVRKLKEELQRLSSVVASMRERNRQQAFSHGTKPAATNKLVWSNDIVLLILLAILFFTLNNQRQDIQRLENAVDALIRWSDQDFLVAP